MKSNLPLRFLLLPVAASAATFPENHRTIADLRSFIHGESVEPAKKAPPPNVTAVVSTAAGVTPDKQVEDFLRAFAEALKAREGSRMLPRLSEKYTMADLPEGHKASEFFVMGVNKTPGPTELVVQSVVSKGTIRIAKVEFHFPTNVKMKTFKFDADGKLLASDLFTLKRVHSGDDESNPHA
jgi:hypothetical protein